jgi:hypothetical protein
LNKSAQPCKQNVNPVLDIRSAGFFGRKPASIRAKKQRGFTALFFYWINA